MRKGDSVYLCHILDSIERIEEYTEGMEKEDFSSNNLVQDGTIRQIEIIGEATKNLSGISEKGILKFPGVILLE
ncbi:MAG: hypothetical protein QG646_4542 [Euryarchaeota archaeon]|nr:hypothetical protein [Euryarchaeota archaeon]